MSFFRWLILTVLALGLAACAGPRWQTVYLYEPPAGEQASACVQRCQSGQSACRLSCGDRYQQCLNHGDLRGRESFDHQMFQHERAMRIYYTEQAIYDAAWHRYASDRNHLSRDQSRHEKRCKDDPRDRTACELSDKLKKDLRRLEHHRPVAPSRPYTPSLADEVAEAQSVCSLDCGCIETYNACFASCGGRVTPEQRCIAHCPDDVKQFEPVRP